MELSRPQAILLTMMAAAAAAIMMLYAFDPATSGVFPPCPLRFLTGWYCPGCGSLRAIHQLLHGDLSRAFALNPFAVLALPFLLYGTLSYMLFVIRGRYLPRLFVPAVWIRTLAVAVVVFGVVRNVPLYPFNLLTPR